MNFDQFIDDEIGDVDDELKDRISAALSKVYSDGFADGRVWVAEVVTDYEKLEKAVSLLKESKMRAEIHYNVGKDAAVTNDDTKCKHVADPDDRICITCNQYVGKCEHESDGNKWFHITQSEGLAFDSGEWIFTCKHCGEFYK